MLCLGKNPQDNYGELAGRVLRLGHIGFDANCRKALSSLYTLEKGLQELGYPVESSTAAKTFNDVWQGQQRFVERLIIYRIVNDQFYVCNLKL